MLHSNKEPHWITERQQPGTQWGRSGGGLVGLSEGEERDDGSSRRQRGTEDGERRVEGLIYFLFSKYQHIYSWLFCKVFFDCSQMPQEYNLSPASLIKGGQCCFDLWRWKLFFGVGRFGLGSGQFKVWVQKGVEYSLQQTWCGRVDIFRDTQAFSWSHSVV